MEASAARTGPRFYKNIPSVYPANESKTAVVQRHTETVAPLCHNLTELFFGPTEFNRYGEPMPEPSDSRLVRELRCAEICAVCPYRIRCLAYFLSWGNYNDKNGFGGGYNPAGRRKIRFWLYHQKIGTIVINEELLWLLEFYEGEQAQSDPVVYLRKRLTNP